jgi:hypothetical protein
MKCQVWCHVTARGRPPSLTMTGVMVVLLSWKPVLSATGMLQGGNPPSTPHAGGRDHIKGWTTNDY